MKVTFQQQETSETEKKRSAAGAAARQTSQAGDVIAAGQSAFASIGNKMLEEMPGCAGEKGKSLIELQEEAADADVAVSRDFMTVMSHTMSEEDYAKMQEEGFDPGSMDPEEAVTIVDRIKAELARAGKNIVGYTDDLDLETLESALGSEALARAVADSFRAMDVPLSKENLSAVSQAWAMSEKLQPMEEGAYSYLIDNELEAEIWNLYLAQSSGAGARGAKAPGYYTEDVRGYYTRSAGAAGSAGVSGSGRAPGGFQASGTAKTQKSSHEEELLRQIDGIILKAGQEVDEDSRGNAQWLLEKGLPVTAENLNRLKELKQIELPVTVERFSEAAAAALAEGKSPVHASLAQKPQTLYEKAAAISDYYHSSELWESYVGDITARRQLEEIRLRMTAEVNVKLLKRGFAIDTAPMEELIDALKQAEHQLAYEYFPRDEAAVDKYNNYRNANAVADHLPGLPADLLGIFAKGRENTSLESFHEEGRALQETYEKAQKSYETLMTAPRSDMGDSIEKAFSNIDDILEDLGLEATEENRRAARILGYNSMDMTVKNLEAVREADRMVQSVITKLTPAATLKMIRDGINPLEKSFGELQEYFDMLPPEYRKEADSYSRFLYGLERNKEITPEERESYIGIYRMVRQIEKADGAVAGALVNAQADIHFANLLSAIQNKKAMPMNLKVVDKNGRIGGLPKKEKSISGQISRAFGFQVSAHKPDPAKPMPWLAPRTENPEQTEKVQADSAYAESGSSVEVILPRDTDVSAGGGGQEAAAGKSRTDSASAAAQEALVRTAKLIMAEASSSEESAREYNKTQMEEQRQAVSAADKECVAMLQRGDHPSSAENLMASQALIFGNENIFEAADRYRSQGRQMPGKPQKGTEKAQETDSASLWQKLEDMDEFAEGYRELTKSALEAVENATFTEVNSSLDVRHMQLLHKQLAIAASLSDREEYYLPMYVGDRMARVHLTLERNSEEKGTVTVGVTFSEEEHVQARLYLDKGKVHGMIFGEGKIDLNKLKETADNFKRDAESSWPVGNITVIPSEKRMPELVKSGEHVRTENAELYRMAKVFLQSVRNAR